MLKFEIFKLICIYLSSSYSRLKLQLIIFIDIEISYFNQWV